jgi:recombination protein RecT
MAQQTQRPAPTYQRSQTALQKQEGSTKETIQQLMAKYKSSIANALPKHLTPERMMRLVFTEIRRVPALEKCDAMSLLGTVIQLAQLGLEPGPALGQAYLIPYKEECTLVIGYRGMVTLARNSGQILSISARAVYDGDDFRVQYGTQEQIVHVPMFKTAVLTHVYAVAQLQGGGVQFDCMSMGEVEAIRQQYAHEKSPAWKNSYDEMAKKTVVRRLFKLLPMSVELAAALDVEEGDQRNHEIIDANHVPVAQESDPAKWAEVTAAPKSSEDDDRRVAIAMLENAIEHREKSGSDLAAINQMFGGKLAREWASGVTTAEIYVAMDKIKEMK